MVFEALRSQRQEPVPSPEDLSHINGYLEGTPPEEILQWAVDTYGEGLALSASFGGPEGMALLDMLSRITKEVTVLTIDTGFLFQETIEFREEVMRRYELPLVVLRSELSIDEQVERYGERMRTCTPDLCCQVRKLEPLKRGLERYEAWMTGIRREQTPQRANTPVVSWNERFGAAKIAPFAFVKEGWVHEYISEHDVPVNPLLKKGYRSIGCEPQTRPVAPDEEDYRAGRWSEMEKTECGLHWVGGQTVRAAS